MEIRRMLGMHDCDNFISMTLDVNNMEGYEDQGMCMVSQCKSM